jgi:hypothetical protein
VKLIAIFVLVLASATQGCSADTPLASMSVLPVPVQEELLSLCAPCEFADSNEAWNSTDLLGGRLPRRHLEKTVQTASGWRIEYQHGGRAVHTHVAQFELEPSVHLVWGSSCVPAPGVECEW